VVYDLQLDPDFARFTGTNSGTIGHLFNRTGNSELPFSMTGSGTAPNRTITITGRSGTGQGLRIRLADIGVRANHEYRFDVAATVANNSNLRLRLEGTPTEPRAEGTATSLTHTATAAQIQADITARTGAAYWSIGNMSGNENMTITGFTITRVCPAGCTACTVHGITIVNGGTGAAFTPASPVAGDTVRVDAGQRTGYVFDSWTVTAGGVTLENAAARATSFTMPAAAVTLTANWRTATVGAIRDTTAAQVVAGMRAGWNLGNTYDSRRDAPWVSVTTTRAHIQAIRAAGFDAIRIPVTWTVCERTNANDAARSTRKATRANNWTISAAFLDRIEEVVGWAYAEGMTVIINAHHEDAIQLHMVSAAADSDAIHRRIWEQIAGRFNNQFGARLIFAGSNEPRSDLNDFVSDGANGQNEAINRQHQIFVDTVRASGGNNEFRSLIIMPHAASARPGALAGLTLPNDPTPNRLIMQVHTYSPFGFTWGGQTIDWSETGAGHGGTVTPMRYFDNIQARATALNLPVILGEWGSQNFNNEAARARHAEWYVREAARRGWVTFVWDNHNPGPLTPGANTEAFGLFNRNDRTWWSRAVVNAIMRGAGITPTLGATAEFPIVSRTNSWSLESAFDLAA
jgi:endoglucanase